MPRVNGFVQGKQIATVQLQAPEIALIKRASLQMKSSETLHFHPPQQQILIFSSTKHLLKSFERREVSRFLSYQQRAAVHSVR